MKSPVKKTKTQIQKYAYIFTLIAALLLMAAITTTWQLALLSLALACLLGIKIQQQKQSPFIEA